MKALLVHYREWFARNDQGYFLARLAEEIESVLRLKPQEREKIARSAQQRVRERFLISHMVEQYESVYKTSFSPSSDNQGKVRR